METCAPDDDLVGEVVARGEQAGGGAELLAGGEEGELGGHRISQAGLGGYRGHGSRAENVVGQKARGFKMNFSSLLKTSTIAGAMVIAAALPAKADWSGLYIGASVGYVWSDDVNWVYTNGNTPQSSIDIEIRARTRQRASYTTDIREKLRHHGHFERGPERDCERRKQVCGHLS